MPMAKILFAQTSLLAVGFARKRGTEITICACSFPSPLSFYLSFCYSCRSGGVGPLDVLSGIQLGLTNQQDSAVLRVGAHFVGFFLGAGAPPASFWAASGHSRAFAAFTATGRLGCCRSYDGAGTLLPGH